MQRQRSRLIVGLVTLAAFVAACDGVTDEGDSNSMANLLAMAAPSEPLELVVEVPGEIAEGESVPMKMILRNTGSEAAQVHMGLQPANGSLEPAHNFFVFAPGGRVVRMRMPGPIGGPIVGFGGGPQTLRPNDALEFPWTWDQLDQDGESVGSGTYQVIGTLDVDAGPDARSEPVSVTIRQ